MSRSCISRRPASDGILLIPWLQDLGRNHHEAAKHTSIYLERDLYRTLLRASISASRLAITGSRPTFQSLRFSSQIPELRTTITMSSTRCVTVYSSWCSGNFGWWPEPASVHFLPRDLGTPHHSLVNTACSERLPIRPAPSAYHSFAGERFASALRKTERRMGREINVTNTQARSLVRSCWTRSLSEYCAQGRSAVCER